MLPRGTDWQNNLWNLYCWRLRLFKLSWTIPCATWTSWTFSEQGFGQNYLNIHFSPHCSMIWWLDDQFNTIDNYMSVSTIIKVDTPFPLRKWINKYILKQRNIRTGCFWDATFFTSDWKGTKSSPANVRWQIIKSQEKRSWEKIEGTGLFLLNLGGPPLYKKIPDTWCLKDKRKNCFLELGKELHHEKLCKLNIWKPEFNPLLPSTKAISSMTTVFPNLTNKFLYDIISNALLSSGTLTLIVLLINIQLILQ